jgi:hypothetical protein
MALSSACPCLADAPRAFNTRLAAPESASEQHGVDLKVFRLELDNLKDVFMR